MQQTLIFAVIFTGSVVLAVMSIGILYFHLQRRNASQKLGNYFFSTQHLLGRKEGIRFLALMFTGNVNNTDKLGRAWRNSTRNGSERHLKSLIDSGQFKEDDTKGIDVPFFALETILAATNNFANCNKLGQGGFGPVYKVRLYIEHDHMNSVFVLILFFCY